MKSTLFLSLILAALLVAPNLSFAGGLPHGTACTGNPSCVAAFGAGSTCNTTSGLCSDPPGSVANGSNCQTNAECQSGHCDTSGTHLCVAQTTTTSGPTSCPGTQTLCEYGGTNHCAANLEACYAADPNAICRSNCNNTVSNNGNTTTNNGGNGVTNNGNGNGVTNTHGNSVTNTGNSVTNTGGETSLHNPLNNVNSLEDLLTAVLGAVISLGTIALVVALVWVGAQFVFAQGQEEKIRDARNALMWTVIGGLVLLGAQTISMVIQSTVGALQ